MSSGAGKGDTPRPFTNYQKYLQNYENTFKPKTDAMKCTECGLDWSGVMNYVCGNPQCPIQVKVTC